MASAESLKRIKDRAETAEQVIKKLKAQLATIRESAIKEACVKEEKKLEAENEKLKSEVESLVQKLVFVETRNGVKQIPLPAKTAATTTPSISTDTPPATKEPSPPVEQTAPAAKKKKEKAPKKQPPPAASDDKPVDVSRLNFKVGLILKAERHPDADTLYVETVDVGEEKTRTIVSGLVKHVSLEQMQNRKALFLCNLKPAKMRGILSEGMIMCASGGDDCEILEIPDDCVPGERAICESYPGEPDALLNPKKKIWEQVAPDLKVNENGLPNYKGDQIVIPGRGIAKAPTLKNVQVK
ncbi:aminoacyl tRNA synthase complex-interacting multifunctional protein 1-like isoform X2 [Tubulanus polymorphus]